jgi:hypothetical protein
MAKLVQMTEAGYIDPFALGQVYLGLKDFDQALETVRCSLEERTPFAAFLDLDPAFDPLRQDSRFDSAVSVLHASR